MLRLPQRTYLGTVKLAELATELGELKPDTVIFDDELTPGQLRNLEKVWDPLLPSPPLVAGRRIGSTARDLKACFLQASLVPTQLMLPRLRRANASEAHIGPAC